MAAIQYPHFMYKQVQSTNSVQDGNGNWVPAPPSWVFHSVCREETNGKGTQINGPDGKAIVFSSTVYMPRGTEKILEGTIIRVTETKAETGAKRVEGKCMKCDINQMNARLWV